MNAEPISIRSLVHHIEHLVLYSLVFWQIILGIWLLLRWVNNNWKIKKTFSVNSPSENKQPIINIDGSSITKNIADEKMSKDMGAVEVDYNKNIFISDVDNKNIKSDKVKGKKKPKKIN